MEAGQSKKKIQSHKIRDKCQCAVMLHIQEIYRLLQDVFKLSNCDWIKGRLGPHPPENQGGHVSLVKKEPVKACRSPYV
jgi:hypothetical protein